MLSLNEAFICIVVKAALAGIELPLSESISWEAVRHDLEVQSIAALPSDIILGDSAVPALAKGQWEKTAWMHTVRWEQILYAQDALVRLMADNGIPMVILKGTAAAMYYPVPWYRTMGDIDFLVREEDYRKAFNVMRSHGYALAEPEDSEDYHYAMEKDGIVFELHRKLAKLPMEGTGSFLMEQVHDGLSHAEWYGLGEYRFPVLPWLPNGLVLLQHIRQHLRKGLGLRQIIDWMMYVDRELDDEKYPRFREALFRTNLEPLALHATRMCQMYLGLREEGISWCASARPQVCEALMEYIMEEGNFGRGAMQEGRGVKVLRRQKSVIHMFVWMQQKGRYHWKAAYKHPFLGHFGFFHELGRYLSWLSNRKNPVKSFVSDIRKSRKQKRMLRRLLS